VARLVTDGGQAVRDLVPQIEAAAARLGVQSDGDRIATARAAVALVEDIRRKPDRAVETLASTDVPTSVAALGTSIVQAADVTAALQTTNWDLIRATIDLGGIDAAAIRDRLVDALTTDELALGLVARLRDATTAATQLLSAAAKPDKSSTDDTSDSLGSDDEADRKTGGFEAGVLTIANFDRVAAERHLEQVRERLRSEALLDLTWQIEELPDADG
jgi:hypothetical protein